MQLFNLPWSSIVQQTEFVRNYKYCTRPLPSKHNPADWFDSPWVSTRTFSNNSNNSNMSAISADLKQLIQFEVAFHSKCLMSQTTINSTYSISLLRKAYNNLFHIWINTNNWNIIISYANQSQFNQQITLFPWCYRHNFKLSCIAFNRKQQGNIQLFYLHLHNPTMKNNCNTSCIGNRAQQEQNYSNADNPFSQTSLPWLWYQLKVNEYTQKNIITTGSYNYA